LAWQRPRRQARSTTYSRSARQRRRLPRRVAGKIDRLADETRNLLDDYKTVMKQIDGLRVYNARLERQIDNQMRRIARSTSPSIRSPSSSAR
jgi:uncharacterized protein (UPF0335 family)